MFLAQICVFVVLPSLMGVWAYCLLREHGMFSARQVGMKFKGFPGGKVLLLVMAVAAVVYGGKKSDGGGTPVTPDDPQPSESAVVVTNFVEFVANGGVGNMATQTFIYGEAKELSSNKFTRAEYDFDGWALSSTGAVEYVDGMVVSNLLDVAGAVVTLYAHWNPLASDGTADGGSETPGGSTGGATAPSDATTNDVPAVATNYFVTFVSNGGTGNMATQTFVYGEAQALSSNLFKRTTYDFAGWALSNTGVVMYAEGAVVSNLSDKAGAVVSLYAQWKRMVNVYDVAFLPNGGQGKMDMQAFFLGQPQSLASNLFARVGYDFTGWATSTNGAAVYADCQIVTNVTTNAGDKVSLYATWKITPLPILSATINGVAWYYTAANGEATIVNRDGDAFVAAAKLEDSDETVINIGTGVETSVGEVLDLAEKVTGVKAQVIYNPRRVGGAERMCADLTIAEKKLNYAPKVMLAEGMRRTFEADENLRR